MVRKKKFRNEFHGVVDGPAIKKAMKSGNAEEHKLVGEVTDESNDTNKIVRYYRLLNFSHFCCPCFRFH